MTLFLLFSIATISFLWYLADKSEKRGKRCAAAACWEEQLWIGISCRITWQPNTDYHHGELPPVKGAGCFQVGV